MTELRLENVSKWYKQGEPVLQELNLTVQSGEFLAIVGPSGSGKTTLLDLICGFEQPSAGKVLLGGEDVTDQPPKARDVAMVFQNYALLPHLTTAENLLFGLKLRKVPLSIRQQKLTWVAKLLDLEDSLDKYPRELSGGQQQRVALGRAIVREPRIFLLDEPLSNLDAALRDQTSQELSRLHQQLGTTLVYVTHAQEEAMVMAERIAILNKGQLHQVDTPQAIYQTPADLFVAGFIGKPKLNLWLGECRDGKIWYQGQALGALHYPRVYEGASVWCGLRCEELSLTPPNQGTLNGSLERIDYLGQESLYVVATELGLKLTIRVQGPPTYQVGDPVAVSLNLAARLLFDVATEKRIEE